MVKRSPDIPCVPSPECKYWDSDIGCHEDTHHIYRRADADTRLKKQFCQLAVNQLVLCRDVHEELETRVGWPTYPSREIMQAEVDDARAY